MSTSEALYWLSKARHAKNCGVMQRKDCDCGKLVALDTLTSTAKELTLLRERSGRHNVSPMPGFHQIEVKIVSGDGTKTLVSVFEGEQERISRPSPFSYQIYAETLKGFVIRLFPEIPVEEAPEDAQQC